MGLPAILSGIKYYLYNFYYRHNLNYTIVKKHLEILKSSNLVQEKIFGRIKIYRYRMENIRAKSLKRLIDIWE